MRYLKGRRRRRMFQLSGFYYTSFVRVRDNCRILHVIV